MNRLVESMYAKVNGAHWIYRGNYLTGIGNSTVLMRSPVLVGSNGAWLGDFRALATGYIPASQTTEFLSQWSNSASLIQQLTSPDYRLNIVYRDNPDEVTGDMTDGLEQVGVLEYAVSRIPGITSAEYLTIAEALYPGLGDLSLSMSALDDEFRLSEHHIYGSSRLGVQRYNMAGNRVREGKLTKTEMNVPTAWYSYSYCDLVDKDKKVPYGNTHNTILSLSRTLGSRYYELTDHLGNVLATVLDRRTAVLMARRDGGKAIDYYKADVVSASDYYPFGMQMPGRTISRSEYRFGFNGIERDNEVSGVGNHYAAQFGHMDARLGRRWNLDPKPDASVSKYALYADNPTWHKDPFLDTPTVGQAAGIANHVYGGESAAEEKLKGGWQQTDDPIPGVTYHDEESGYDAGLYSRKVNGKTEYVFATRGTEGDWDDISADIKQPFGLSRQYFINYENARALQKYFGSNTDLTFTGHSLGGGLAAANAMATDHPAITFNAAGVGVFTKGIISKDFPNFVENLTTPVFMKIDAYVVRGEILNMIQRPIGLGADGTIHKIAPSIFSLYRYDFTGISNHTMKAVKNALNNENVE